MTAATTDPAAACPHDGLVRLVARPYRACGLPEADVVQAGHLGLIRAAARFDPARGAKFSTYATYWIRKAIVHEIRWTARLVRVPKHAWGDGSAYTPHASLDGADADGIDPRPVPALDALIAREDLARLAAALDRLPPPEAAAIALSFGLGGEAPLSGLAVAARLGIPKDRAYLALRRALAALREGLGDAGGP